MPELPEVETTLRGIAPYIQHQIITDVIVRKHQLRWPIPTNIKQLLVGQSILDLQRRGKYLLLQTEQHIVIIHLGMSGVLRIFTSEPPKADKHDHVDILFNNNTILRFTDPRRFGALLLMHKNSEHTLLKNLGVEPLSKNFNAKYLWSKARNKKVSIKSFLMNHHIVTGIGNIYATEALFAAKIDPTIPAKSLTFIQIKVLVKHIKKILQKAIKRGGTTLKDFLNSNGKPGYFSNHLKVYGREGLPCVICNTTIQTKKIGQRTTAYCKRCQANGRQKVKG